MERIARLWPAALIVGVIAVVFVVLHYRAADTSAPVPALTTPRAMGLPLPTLVDADGDGDEDLLIVGRLIDGTTWATRWNVPEILQVVGRRAVAAHGRGIKVFDLATGHETASLTLAADVSGTCVETDKLVVHQSDGAAFTFDPESGTRSDTVIDCHPADRPPMCFYAKADCSLVGRGNLRLTEPPVNVEIIYAEDGASLVSLDDKGGWRFHRVIDEQGRRIADLDLVDKRVFVFQDGARAFDAMSGRLLWRNDTGKRMRVGARHVYLSIDRDRGPALDVLDAKTGRLITTLLRE